MSMEDRLRRVFSDVFGVGVEELGEESSPETIEQWDSVAHLSLVLALEGDFAVQFDIEEIPELVSFRVIRDRLEELGAG
ncbi:MAG: acyl carrier protein [Gemmatimonadota bacterium]|jgi:acyl carrier protein